MALFVTTKNLILILENYFDLSFTICHASSRSLLTPYQSRPSVLWLPDWDVPVLGFPDAVNWTSFLFIVTLKTLKVSRG